MNSGDDKCTVNSSDDCTMHRAKMIVGQVNGASRACRFAAGGVSPRPANIAMASTAAGRPQFTFPDSDDDVVIVSALRTPICKSKRGGLKVHESLQIMIFH